MTLLWLANIHMLSANDGPEKPRHEEVLLKTRTIWRRDKAPEKGEVRLIPHGVDCY